ncbi:MAG: N-acetyl-gamma-glutamyl-phosphate reductase [Rhodothermales bacterium]|jgi:N-acetyl-gamma-glutamyl-phosphate reductase
MIRAAVFGAAGYAGEELLRILTRHPEITISAITSRSNAGKPVADVFPRFADLALTFVQPDVPAIAADADVAFLALPHGLAAEFAKPLVEAGVRVIDISADFRLDDEDAFAEYYGGAHPAPELMHQAVYGMPERNRDAIRDAQLIACPGCYPTSIILPLSPLLRDGLVSTRGITSCSMSGVSGAGRSIALPFLFAECNESVRPYKVTGHRHLPEIEQELSKEAGSPVVINFIPHLVPITRGIHSTIVADLADGVDEDAIAASLNRAYANESFVRVLPPGKLADTKHVVLTNSVEIGYACDVRSRRVILSSAEDNLTKGASGQAVQCLNVMFGFAESAGLT